MNELETHVERLLEQLSRFSGHESRPFIVESLNVYRAEDSGGDPWLVFHYYEDDDSDDGGTSYRSFAMPVQLLRSALHSALLKDLSSIPLIGILLEDPWDIGGDRGVDRWKTRSSGTRPFELNFFTPPDGRVARQDVLILEQENVLSCRVAGTVFTNNDKYSSNPALKIIRERRRIVLDVPSTAKEQIQTELMRR